LAGKSEWMCDREEATKRRRRGVLRNRKELHEKGGGGKGCQAGVEEREKREKRETGRNKTHMTKMGLIEKEGVATGDLRPGKTVKRGMSPEQKQRDAVSGRSCYEKQAKSKVLRKDKTPDNRTK